MKRLFIVAKLSLAIFLFWYLVHTSKLSFSLLRELLYSPSLLILALCLSFLSVTISAWRWYQLNHVQRIPLTFTQTLLPTYLGIAFNNLLPGTVGGDFYRFYFLTRRVGDKKSLALLTISFDRMTGLMGVFLMAGLFALIELPFFKNTPHVFYFISLCFLFCVGGLGMFILLLLLPQKHFLSPRIQTYFKNKKWVERLVNLLKAIQLYRNAKWAIVECLLISIVVQSIIALICSLAATMMHFPGISFSNYVMAAAVTQIVSLIPLSPGGFGVGEMAFANILALLNPGIGVSYATIFLAYRMIGMASYLPGLAVFIFDHRLIHKIAAPDSL